MFRFLGGMFVGEWFLLVGIFLFSFFNTSDPTTTLFSTTSVFLLQLLFSLNFHADNIIKNDLILGYSFWMYLRVLWRSLVVRYVSSDLVMVI